VYLHNFHVCSIHENYVPLTRFALCWICCIEVLVLCRVIDLYIKLFNYVLYSSSWIVTNFLMLMLKHATAAYWFWQNWSFLYCINTLHEKFSINNMQFRHFNFNATSCTLWLMIFCHFFTAIGGFLVVWINECGFISSNFNWPNIGYNVMKSTKREILTWIKVLRKRNWKPMWKYTIWKSNQFVLKSVSIRINPKPNQSKENLKHFLKI